MLKPARTFVRCVTRTATSPPTPTEETFTAAPAFPESPRIPTAAGAGAEDDCGGADCPDDGVADWPNPPTNADSERLQRIAVRINRFITFYFSPCGALS